jgi:hypothetical protein
MAASISRRRGLTPDDQTPDEWLDFIANDPQALGTGLYLITTGAAKEYQSKIYYDNVRSTAVAGNFFAFKWVPHSVATEQQLLQDICQARCAKRCFKPGCLCDTGLGRCT